MKYRTLGRTGLSIPEIGFGCGNVGGMMVRGSHQEQVDSVNRALELGINYFDTAPAYGQGQSETHLGEVLREIKPDITVATKVGLTADDMKDIKGAVLSSMETSLGRLGLDSVDILQLHTPVTMGPGESGGRFGLIFNDVLGENGVADAFRSVQEQGMVRFLGFTGLGETEALHKLVESDRFDLVQTYYNLLNPSAGRAVPSDFAGQDFRQLIDLAAGRNMGTVVIRVMAGGALGGTTARGGYASPSVGGALSSGSEYSRDEFRAAKLGFLTAGDLDSLPQAAVRFALMHQSVSTVLVGYSDIAQIEEAAAASDKNPIPDSDIGRLAELWAADFGI